MSLVETYMLPVSSVVLTTAIVSSLTYIQFNHIKRQVQSAYGMDNDGKELTFRSAPSSEAKEQQRVILQTLANHGVRFPIKHYHHVMIECYDKQVYELGLKSSWKGGLYYASEEQERAWNNLMLSVSERIDARQTALRDDPANAPVLDLFLELWARSCRCAAFGLTYAIPQYYVQTPATLCARDRWYANALSTNNRAIFISVDTVTADCLNELLDWDTPWPSSKTACDSCGQCRRVEAYPFRSWKEIALSQWYWLKGNVQRLCNF